MNPFENFTDNYFETQLLLQISKAFFKQASFGGHAVPSQIFVRDSKNKLYAYVFEAGLSSFSTFHTICE